MKTTSWRAKVAKPRQSKRVVLETDFAGIKAGMLNVGRSWIAEQRSAEKSQSVKPGSHSKLSKRLAT